MGPNHDIVVENNWHNQNISRGCATEQYKSTCPLNMTVRDNVQVEGDAWPAEALAVEAAAGVQSDRPIRVSCVGDSITIYACASNDSMPYPAQLQRMLGSKFNVSNLGNSGHTLLKDGLCGGGGACLPVPQCGGDCSYWNATGPCSMPGALASTPDVVTIMLGTNDAKSCNWDTEINGLPLGVGTQFTADYIAMIQSFKAIRPAPLVYVVLPPPLTTPPSNSSCPPPFNMSRHAINEQFPLLQRQICADAMCDGVIDIWSVLGGAGMDPALTCDGCHPKDEALTVIARTIAATLMEAFS